MSYEVKGKTKSIKGTSRCAMCIKDRFSGKDNYYTIEVTEERDIPDVEDVNMDKEYEALFDSINDVVDNQMEQIVKAVKGE